MRKSLDIRTRKGPGSSNVPDYKQSTRVLVADFNGYKLFERTNEDFVYFDDKGDFMYAADPVRFGKKQRISALNNEELVKLTSFRYLPKKAVDEGQHQQLGGLVSQTEDLRIQEPSASLNEPFTAGQSIVGSASVSAIPAVDANEIATPGSTGATPVKPSGPSLVLLRWNKMKRDDIPGSIFESLPTSSVVLDEDEVKRLFSRAVLKAEMVQEAVAEKQYAEILPYGRRLSVSIVLSSLNMKADQILHLISSGTCFTKDEDELYALLSVCPSADEEKELSSKQFLRDKVDDSEKFMLDLCKDPLYTGLCEYFRGAVLYKSFDRVFDSLVFQMKTIADICKSLLESSALPRFLKTMLKFGNLVNASSSSLRDAKGFQLSDCMAMTLSKSQRGDLTMFDMLIEIMIHIYPGCLEQLHKDLSLVNENISKLTLDTLSDELHEFETYIGTLKQIAGKAQAAGLTHYSKTMSSHFSNYEKKTIVMTKLFEKMQERMNRVLVLFCDKSKATSSRLLQIIMTLHELDEAVVKNEARHAERKSKNISIREAALEDSWLPPGITSVNDIPLRNLHWTKIRDNNITPESIWAKEIDETTAVEFDNRSIAYYFGKWDSREAVPVDGAQAAQIVVKEEFLNPKRKHNVAILLATLHLSPEDAVALAKQPELGFKAEEKQLAALAQIAPEDDEKQILKEAMGRNAQFDDVEQFLYVLSSADKAKDRFELLLLAQSFENNANLLLHDSTCMINACKELLSSTKLSQIYAVILVLGNLLNKSNAQLMDARGFKPDVFKTMNETKSPLKSITITQYVVRVGQKSFPGAFPISVDLASVMEASTKNLGCMEQVYAELKSTVKKAREVYANHELDSMIAKWTRSVESVESNFGTMDKCLQQVCIKFLGAGQANQSNPKKSRALSEGIIQEIAGFVTTTNEILAEAVEQYAMSALERKRSGLKSSRAIIAQVQSQPGGHAGRSISNRDLPVSAAMSFFIRKK